MKENVFFKKEIEFENTIAEISSISLEEEHKIDGELIKGNFLLEGEYKSHEISLNKERFSYRLPFTYEFKNKPLEESIKLKIEDFTYDINSNSLMIEIEYKVEAEEELYFEERKELDKFLNERDMDVIDFSKDEEKEIDVIDFSKDEETKYEPIKEESRIKEEITVPIDTEFITYHVYTFSENDSVESICTKYGVTPDLLFEYNEMNNIKVGDKLLIPYNE